MECTMAATKSKQTNNIIGTLLVIVLEAWLLQLVGCNVARRSTLELFSTLRADETLVSPNGVFEAGIFPLPGTSSTDSRSLMLGIRYASPIGTWVWMAVRYAPVSSVSYLQFTSDGRLVLLYDDSAEVWTSSSKSLNAQRASLLDTGNLVLLDLHNSTVWQSFDSPTDTLLPGQKYSLNSSTTIYSWKAWNDTAEGSYKCIWDSLKRFILASSSVGRYFPEGDFPSTSEYAYVDISGNLYLSNSTTEKSTRLLSTVGTSATSDRLLRRVTLDGDGGLRIYNWTVGQSSNWSIEVDWVQDHCVVHGACGPYALCTPTTGPVGHRNSICSCPDGFYFINPDNHFLGCRRIVPLTSTLCQDPNSFKLSNLMNVDYPLVGDYWDSTGFSLNDCVQKCLSLCSCEVLIYSYNRTKCWIKQGRIWNGRHVDPDNTEYDSDRNTFFKISTFPQTALAPTPSFGDMPTQAYTPSPSPGDDDEPSLSHRRHPHHNKLVTFLSAFGGALIIIIVLVIWRCYFGWTKKVEKALEKKLGELQNSPYHKVTNFTYYEMKIATNNFQEVIGKGGFGSVYKGKIGGDNVAIKRLKNLNMVGEKGFVTEVVTIGSIHHVNLVRLYGYCAVKSYRLLVYEYVEQGSLDKFIFRNGELPILEWSTRFNIVVEIAKALVYLHEDCHDYKIIHRDIKPENILLDKFFHVKLADFGIAKLMDRNHTHTLTQQGMGTPGYVAPESCYEHAQLTPKIDVYSFGMVVLEIVSGRRNLTNNYFPILAMQKMDIGAYVDIVDPALETDFDLYQVQMLVRIAIWCINERPEIRPSTRLILQILEGHVFVDDRVPRPTYLKELVDYETSPCSNDQISTQSNLSSIEEVSMSIDIINSMELCN